MKKVNYYQDYMSSNLAELNNLKQIIRVDWADVTDEYPGEYLPECLSGIEIEDSEGSLFCMAIHDPNRSRVLYDTDCILLNILAQRIFTENNVACSYNFPLNLDYVCGLVNDARKLLRMKNRGEDLSAFEFEFCLLDVRQGQWVNIAADVYNDSFGYGRNEQDWDKLIDMIQKG